MDERRMVRLAGASLVTSAVGFIAVFSLLAAKFDYPDVLDQPASIVLPALLRGGGELQAIWWVYSMLPLLLLPAAAGAFQALRGSSEGLMRTASYFAVLAAFSLTLGLIRWPSVNHELALLHAAASEVDRPAIEAMATGLNRYLGTYVGEQLGELFLNGWFVMSGFAMIRSSRFPHWSGWVGVGIGFLGLVGMFRFATVVVRPVADVNNLLLPAWLIAFGLILWHYGPMPDQSRT